MGSKPSLHSPVTGQRGDWLPGGGRDKPRGRCKPSCCKTPLGHSTVRDNLPASHSQRCRCHDEPKE